jgi:hypothetical protein
MADAKKKLVYIRTDTRLILSRIMLEEIEPKRLPNENKATAIEALWTLPLSAKTTYKLITMLKREIDAPCSANEKNHFLKSIFQPFKDILH